MIYGGFKFTELIRLAYGVLDWGLGHATRSVPVIKALINRGVSPFLVGSGNSLSYLKQVFPSLEVETLPNSDITYRVGKPAWQSVLWQVNKLHHWNNQVQVVANRFKEAGYTHFISDNLYGFHANGAKNALITHQTSPAFPLMFPGATCLSERLMRHYLKPFDHLWIPIQPECKELIQELTVHQHPQSSYIGWLSALKKEDLNQTAGPDWLILLSGPEGYRTSLEQALIKYWPSKIPAYFVRGTNQSLSIDLEAYQHFKFYDQLNTNELQPIWLSSSKLIARSGYSSVMDAIVFDKKAIWIPTPGQTEQQLLAKRLVQQQRGISLNQSKINQIATAIQFFDASYPSIVSQSHYRNDLLDVALSQFLDE